MAITGRGRFNITATDEYGNIIPGASIEIRDETALTLSTLYEDRDGTTPKSNPLTADVNGYAYAYAALGYYQVSVDAQGRISTLRDVEIGRSPTGGFNWRGAWGTATAYVLDDVVTGSDGALYVCTVAHTSAAATAPISGASYATVWDLFLATDGVSTNFVANRTLLKALDEATIKAAVLTESGRQGTFVFLAGDYSTQVTADTLEGIYIEADGTASTSGAWVRVYDGPVRPEWFGAAGNGTTDDYLAITAALTMAGAGGEVLCTARYRTNTTIAVPLGCTLSGLNRNPHNYNMEDLIDGGSVILLSSASISLTTDSALFGLSIFPFGLTFPANAASVAAWTGVGVSLLGSHAGHSVTHCAIGGFEYGMTSAAINDTSNITLTDLLMDNINCIVLDSAYDVCYITRVHCEPGLSRGLTDADGERTGKGIVLANVSDWSKITDSFVFAYNRSIELFAVNSCTLSGVGVDYFGAYSTNASPWGITVSDDCTETVITNCQAASYDKGFVIAGDATYSMTRLSACTVWDCDTVGFDFSDGDAIAVGCHARQCGVGFDSISAAAGVVVLTGCSAQACTLGIDNTHDKFVLSNIIYQGNTTDVTNTALRAIASATTITPDPSYSVYRVTGTTNIATINNANAFMGRELTLYFAAAQTLQTSGNLKLDGAATVAVDGGDVIKFFAADDGFWHQVSARINT